MFPVSYSIRGITIKRGVWGGGQSSGPIKAKRVNTKTDTLHETIADQNRLWGRSVARCPPTARKIQNKPRLGSQFQVRLRCNVIVST